jgi:hypothetical protein
MALSPWSGRSVVADVVPSTTVKHSLAALTERSFSGASP